MTAPIVHTTVTELATERFWAEHIDPVARAHGIEMPTTLDRDLDDHQAHLLKDAAGNVILTVRTDLEDMSRKDEPPPFEDLAPRPTPQDGEAYRAYALISNHLQSQPHRADPRGVVTDLRDQVADFDAVPYEALHMRAEGDMRKDAIIKLEIFDREIRDKYNVIAVFDDRRQQAKERKAEREARRQRRQENAA